MASDLRIERPFGDGDFVEIEVNLIYGEPRLAGGRRNEIVALTDDEWERIRDAHADRIADEKRWN